MFYHSSSFWRRWRRSGVVLEVKVCRMEVKVFVNVLLSWDDMICF